MKLILLGKSRPGFEEAIAELRNCPQLETLEIVEVESGTTFQEVVFEDWACDILISYLAPFVLPQRILNQVRRRAVNFHPGPPEYPGTGCTNFALYEGATTYGVTAHLMARNVDSGPIIAVRRFEASSYQTVQALTTRTYQELELLFKQTLPAIVSNESLKFCGEEWTRKPFTRKELEELRIIEFGCSPEEVLRRIKATSYPGYKGAEIRVGEYVFELHQTQPDVNPARK